MARRAKMDKDFVIYCCHCAVDDFKLNDVDKEAPVRHYTDTPAKYDR